MVKKPLKYDHVDVRQKKQIFIYKHRACLAKNQNLCMHAVVGGLAIQKYKSHDEVLCYNEDNVLAIEVINKISENFKLRKSALA